MNDIETQLHHTLQAIAERTAVEDRLPEVLSYTPRERPTRHHVFVAVAVFVVVTVGLGSAILMTREADPQISSTAVPPSTDSPVGVLAEHSVTLLDGTEVVIRMPLIEGSDVTILWSAGLKGGPDKEPYANALVHIWLHRSAAVLSH